MVRQTFGQGSFGTDHHQIGSNLLRQRHDGVHIRRLYVASEFAMLRHAGITGRDDKPRNAGRLGDFPGQGVLAPSRTDEQNVHNVGMMDLMSQVKINVPEYSAAKPLIPQRSAG